MNPRFNLMLVLAVLGAQLVRTSMFTANELAHCPS